MPGAGRIGSGVISSGHSRSVEDLIHQDKKKTFEGWQENTLASLDRAAKEALEELDIILTNNKDLAKSLGLASEEDTPDERSVTERIISVLNLLQPSLSIVLVGAPQAPQELSFDPWMATEKINFSVRVSNCLRNDSIDYLGQLVSLTEKQMLRMPYFGKKTLGEVKVVLETIYGAHLGMKHPELDAVLQKHPLSGYLVA